MPKKEMNASRRAIVGLIVCQAWAPTLVGQSVFVQQEQSLGNGLIRTRGVECFVVTPEHVVNDSRTVRLVREAGRNATGTFDRRIGGVALVRVVEAFVEGFCDDVTPWPKQQDVDSLLERASTGAMRIVTPSGSISLVQVNLSATNERYVQVAPQSGQPRLILGNSGSALLVDGVVSGMLDSVSTVRAGTLGRVLRIDHACGQLETFFGPCTTPDTAPAATNPCEARPRLCWDRHGPDTHSVDGTVLASNIEIETIDEAYQRAWIDKSDAFIYQDFKSLDPQAKQMLELFTEGQLRIGCNGCTLRITYAYVLNRLGLMHWPIIER